MNKFRCNYQSKKSVYRIMVIYGNFDTKNKLF